MRRPKHSSLTLKREEKRRNDEMHLNTKKGIIIFPSAPTILFRFFGSRPSALFGAAQRRKMVLAQSSPTNRRLKVACSFFFVRESGGGQWRVIRIFEKAFAAALNSPPLTWLLAVETVFLVGYFADIPWPAVCGNWVMCGLSAVPSKKISCPSMNL